MMATTPGMYFKSARSAPRFQRVWRMSMSSSSAVVLERGAPAPRRAPCAAVVGVGVHVPVLLRAEADESELAAVEDEADVEGQPLEGEAVDPGADHVAVRELHRRDPAEASFGKAARTSAGVMPHRAARQATPAAGRPAPAPPPRASSRRAGSSPSPRRDTPDEGQTPGGVRQDDRGGMAIPLPVAGRCPPINRIPFDHAHERSSARSSPSSAPSSSPSGDPTRRRAAGRATGAVTPCPDRPAIPEPSDQQAPDPMPTPPGSPADQALWRRAVDDEQRTRAREGAAATGSSGRPRNENVERSGPRQRPRRFRGRRRTASRAPEAGLRSLERRATPITSSRWPVDATRGCQYPAQLRRAPCWRRPPDPEVRAAGRGPGRRQPVRGGGRVDSQANGPRDPGAREAIAEADAALAPAVAPTPSPAAK